MKVTDYLVEKLGEYGVDVIFGYTGGNIADLIDSIALSTCMQFVQTYNEQAAAFAANSYAQIKENIGVAISSSGPGAINLINGIANAFFDSIPCLFITGNVHSMSRKNSDSIRQNAFQELDIVSMVKGIAKYCVYIDSAEDIRFHLEKAVYLATTERKGPVLLDIPYDIQRKEINPEALQGFSMLQQEYQFNITYLKEALLKATRPLILVGGGCLYARDSVRRLLEKTQIPVVTSMRGIDIVPNGYPGRCGCIGTYGNRTANLAIKYCDLLIVLGARLDERQMGYRKNEFAPRAKIIQVDVDLTELGRKTDNEVSIYAPVELVTQQLEKMNIKINCKEWIKLLNQWCKKFDAYWNNKEFYPNIILNELFKNLNENSIVTLDVGQNQILSIQSMYVKNEERVLCSAGLGCMGYSLPAAIGAVYANPKAKIVSINGDGGLQMNLQELQTIKRDKLPIIIVVINNHSLALIRELQDKLFSHRYSASINGYEAPNLAKIAYAYDMEYVQVNDLKDMSNLEKLLNKPQACIIDIELELFSGSYLQPGEQIGEQNPLLSEYDKREIKRQIMELQ